MSQWQRYGKFNASLLSIWSATEREALAVAATLAGARVGVINIASAERSCDGEMPVKLQPLLPADDNQPTPAIEAVQALAVYVGHGFRVVGCHDQPGGKSRFFRFASWLAIAAEQPVHHGKTATRAARKRSARNLLTF